MFDKLLLCFLVMMKLIFNIKRHGMREENVGRTELYLEMTYQVQEKQIHKECSCYIKL